MVNGTPQSVAWYEFYGDQTPSTQSPNPNPKGPDYYQQNISQTTFPVRPGDIISASVSLVPGTTREFLFQMTDQPVDGAKLEVFSTLQTMQYVTPARSTVEWIVENPNNGKQQLAGFSSMRFTGAWATVNSTTSDINQLSNLVNIPMGSGTTAFTSVSNPPEVDYGVGYTEPASGTWSSSFYVYYNTSVVSNVVVENGATSGTGSNRAATPANATLDNGTVESTQAMGALGQSTGTGDPTGAVDALLADADIWSGISRRRERVNFGLSV